MHEIPAGLLHYHTNIGGGAVMEDLDGDGDLDLFVSNGAGAKALYWNNGDGTFMECAERAGVSLPGDWTNGVSAADYDNDGDQDLYLLNHGKNRLLQNQGDGRFFDVTDTAGVGNDGNGASASWADIDGDGHLDLFVANLAEAFTPSGTFKPGMSVLYRNRGDGTFEDVTGAFPPDGRLLGSSYLGVLLDFDQDGVTDLLVTQEFDTQVPNRLYRGDRLQGTTMQWEDVTATSGITGPGSVMGAAILDVDGDARPDVYLTNLWGSQPNREILFQNGGHLVFGDVTVSFNAFAMNADVTPGLATRTSSWGVAVLDLGNRGSEDLYVVYGELLPGPDFQLNGSAYPPMRTRQQNALFRREGLGAFTLLQGTCAEEAGAGRGVVAGDVDGDGCEDLYVINRGQPARLLRNLCADSGRFIELNLVGTRSNRDAVGAQVTVASGGREQVKWLVAGTSVHSSQPKRMHFGLGAAEIADVTIRWPSGQEQHVAGLEAGRLHEIVETR